MYRVGCSRVVECNRQCRSLSIVYDNWQGWYVWMLLPFSVLSDLAARRTDFECSGYSTVA